MKRYSEETFNNPLPYIFIIFILSSLCYEIHSKNKLLAIFIAGSFFILLYIFKGKYITFILLLFFIASILNNIWFYGYKASNIEEIRIVEAKSYYGKGKINGRLVNLVNINNKIKVGQRIVANGEFSENKNISKGYIGDFKINYYEVRKDDLISYLYKRREDTFNKIEEKLGNRKAALITSVAFGYKSQLDDDDREIMRSLGISHAISVSGLHLALVFGVLAKVFGVKLALIISLFYVLFTGASPPSIRAYIMIFIMSFGALLKRNYNPLAALSLAGIIILLIKPYEAFGLGFILSFLATLGIILYNKKLNKKMYKLPKSIRGTIAISLSAQVLTLPILILYFNEVSLNFLLGNILIVPLITVIVILGNILLVIQRIPSLFNYILYLCHYVIKIIDIIIYKVDDIGFGLLYLHHSIAYFYISIITTYYFYKKGFKRFIYYPLIMAVYIGVLIYSPFPTIRYYRDGGLLISYRGDRVLIQTKSYIDEEKIKNVTLAKEVLTKVNKINIGKEIVIYKHGENYMLHTKSNQYLLLVNFEKINTECDIIDFRKGDIEEILLFNDKVITER